MAIEMPPLLRSFIREGEVKDFVVMAEFPHILTERQADEVLRRVETQPELLEVLKNWCTGPVSPNPYRMVEELDEHMKKALAVIAKAEGRT